MGIISAGNLFHSLSQENPNYSFLLPFAQYNLQCPGYYLPVLQGKWVYPHSNSTCRIWNKIISHSAITRDPHRGGWVGCGQGGRASGGIFLALWQKEMYLLPSLLLVGDFCRNRVFSLNSRPSVTYRQRPFCKIPYIRFFLVYQSLCLTFVWVWHAQETNATFRHRVGLATPTRRMATFLGDQCD